MLCLGCGYSLQGLDRNSCPECARAFDPSDPTTFDVKSSSIWRRHALLVLLAPPWIAVIGGHSALVMARLQLGRWPHRDGLDDPKYIPGVMYFGWVWFAGLVLTFPCLVATVVAVFGPRPRYSLCASRELSVLLIGIAWAAALILLFADFARVGVWLLD